MKLIVAVQGIEPEQLRQITAAPIEKVIMEKTIFH